MENNLKLKIGLEVHIQMKTKSKLFSAAAENGIGVPNENTTCFDVGYPGTLPLLNEHALELAARTGSALNCTINEVSIFDRKHYFYPDSPNGYQITQQYHPICSNGYLDIPGKRIRINKIHIEGDAGKMVHSGSCSYLDWNRSGIALMELVTEPDINSSEEAVQFVTELILILQYIDTCGCNLENGEIRFDVNISILNGNRIEVKNLNSIKFMKEAIEYEIIRQKEMADRGEEITRETRLYDSDNGVTKSLRKKEQIADYRYMQDMNLPPVVLEKSWIERIKRNLPKLPSQLREENKDLNKEALDVLINNPNLYNYFSKILEFTNERNLSASFLTSDINGLVNKTGIKLEDSKITPKNIGEICNLVKKNEISNKTGKYLIEKSFNEVTDVYKVIKEENLGKITDINTITNMCNEAITNYPKEVERFKNGNDKLIEFFVGQILKASSGRADADLVRETMKSLLK